MRNKIILLHGALGSKAQFEKLKGILSSQNEIYDFNFDGHGGVPTEEDFSIDLFADNTLRFIREKNHKTY